MELFRQAIDALFQPVDLSFNSFEPFVLVDFSPVFEDADGMGLNAGDMLVAPTLQRVRAGIQNSRGIFQTIQYYDAGNDHDKEFDQLSRDSGHVIQQHPGHRTPYGTRILVGSASIHARRTCAKPDCSNR